MVPLLVGAWRARADVWGEALMFKEKSQHQQRGARKAALNPKTEIDETVWRGVSADEHLERRHIKQKELEAALGDVSAKIARSRSDFARTGKRNPHYHTLLAEKARLAREFGESQIEAIKLRQLRRRERAERSAAALETKGDVFKRVARLMLADDVYNRLAQIAGEEWERLYDRPPEPGGK